MEPRSLNILTPIYATCYLRPKDAVDAIKSPCRLVARGVGKPEDCLWRALAPPWVSLDGGDGRGHIQARIRYAIKATCFSPKVCTHNNLYPE